MLFGDYAVVIKVNEVYTFSDIQQSMFLLSIIELHLQLNLPSEQCQLQQPIRSSTNLITNTQYRSSDNS